MDILQRNGLRILAMVRQLIPHDRRCAVETVAG